MPMLMFLKLILLSYYLVSIAVTIVQISSLGTMLLVCLPNKISSYGVIRTTLSGIVGKKHLYNRLKSTSLSSSSSKDGNTTTGVSTSLLHKHNLNKLRDYMRHAEIDAFIVPTDDPHMSEYTAPFYARREYISGFTGSAGTAVIMRDKALLFVDGRYHEQADIEVDRNEWNVMKLGLKDVPSYTEYLTKNMPTGTVVGVDPSLHAAAALDRINQLLNNRNIRLKMLTSNPIDEIWNADTDNARALLPSSQVRVHPLEYAGKSTADKLKDIRTVLKLNNAASLVITSLDEIAYVYNIRGGDVPCNPVSIAYAVINQDSAVLFIDVSKISTDVKVHLQTADIQIQPYNNVLPYIARLSSDKNKKVWVDSKTANNLVYTSIPVDQRVVKDSPIILMKALKNEAEIAGMKACHIRDGAAMAEFLSWLEDSVSIKKQPVSEVDIDIKVTACRAACNLFIEPSFFTIAGVGSNGAIVHYRAVDDTCKMLTDKELLLLDSGGQYIDGTTDVTRTFHMGTPSSHQIEMFTRVLKGNIGVDSRIFPSGTPGCLLDSYAREHLWAIGKDYIHGTGHGVGAALNVHEGPHRISRNLDPQPLMPGMVVSNEPGYYEANNFGIRIENLLLVVKKDDIPDFGNMVFLGFEKLTHIPIQQKMIDKGLLTSNEIKWLNQYNRMIIDKVYPLLTTDRARQWLIDNTKEM